MRRKCMLTLCQIAHRPALRAQPILASSQVNKSVTVSVCFQVNLFLHKREWMDFFVRKFCAILPQEVHEA